VRTGIATPIPQETHAMTLPSIIDVAIGLVLMFFILASLGSVLAEFVAAHQKWRHKLLRSTVTRLLEPETTRKFWTHPLILPLFARTPRTVAPRKEISSASAPTTTKKSHWMAAWKNRTTKMLRPFKSQIADAPAYLEGKLFASVVLDLATGEGAIGRLPSTTTAWAFTIRTHIPSIPGENNDLQDRLLALLRQVPPDAPDCSAALKTAVAKWYDEAMTRTSGEYRRHLQKWLFIIGCGLAVLFNCDALRIATVLYQSPTLRAQVAQQGEAFVQEKTSAAGQTTSKVDAAINDKLKEQLKENIGQLRDLTKIGFPIGWSPIWRDNFILKPEPPQKADSASEKSDPTPSGKKEDSSTGTKSAPPAKPVDLPIAAPASFWSWFPDWPGRLFHFVTATIAVAIEPGLASWLAKFAGLFATAFAVCLGAPFWFDLLGRLVKMRSSAGSEAEKKKSDSPEATTSGTATANTASNQAASAGSPAIQGSYSLPSLLDALNNPAIEFSTSRTYWLAQAADHAYETNRDTARTWLLQQGQPNVQFFNQPATDTQAFLSWGNGVAILAFRGTEKNLIDWTNDAKLKLVDATPHGLSGKIHEGFSLDLESIWPDLLAALNLLKGQRVLLHVTGHSLGAALATLAALRIARQRTLAVQSVHTFGSTRVGDETFVREFDTTFKGRSFRIVNNEDLVTRIPPREAGYKHVNEIIYIDEAGRLQRDIGYWFRFLNFVTNALDDLKKALETTVKDHSMTLYCGHLQKAANKSDTIV
jgi:triacylglycerol lipase